MTELIYPESNEKYRENRGWGKKCKHDNPINDCSICKQEEKQRLESENKRRERDIKSFEIISSFSNESIFYNPLLLQLNMFLAELTWIRFQKYEYPFRVCTHFTKDLFDEATKREIRCACAIIEFENSPTGHALIAYDTDYARIYIEPQNANKEIIKVGSRYPSQLQGLPGNDIVSSIDTLWNDKDIFFWLTCNNCGYVIPSREPISICPACGSSDVKPEKYEPPT